MTDPLHLAPTDPAVPVRDPATGDPLPESGARVPASGYWRRRLADGDVRRIAPPAPPKPASPKPAARRPAAPQPAAGKSAAPKPVPAGASRRKKD